MGLLNELFSRTIDADGQPWDVALPPPQEGATPAGEDDAPHAVTEADLLPEA